MHEGDCVGKRRTKTQEKRMYTDILNKAYALLTHSPASTNTSLTVKDFGAIKAICEKYLKRF